MKTSQKTTVIVNNKNYPHEIIGFANGSYYIKNEDGIFVYNSEEMCEVYNLIITELDEIQKILTTSERPIMSAEQQHQLKDVVNLNIDQMDRFISSTHTIVEKAEFAAKKQSYISIAHLINNFETFNS